MTKSLLQKITATIKNNALISALLLPIILLVLVLGFNLYTSQTINPDHKLYFASRDLLFPHDGTNLEYLIQKQDNKVQLKNSQELQKDLLISTNQIDKMLNSIIFYEYDPSTKTFNQIEYSELSQQELDYPKSSDGYHLIQKDYYPGFPLTMGSNHNPYQYYIAKNNVYKKIEFSSLPTQNSYQYDRFSPYNFIFLGWSK